MRAGASLVQLYTGLIYAGVGVLAEIKERLIAEMETTGAATLGALCGTDADRWAAIAI